MSYITLLYPREIIIFLPPSKAINSLIFRKNPNIWGPTPTVYQGIVNCRWLKLYSIVVENMLTFKDQF